MHKRNLPHIYPENAAFFITFRLKNSIPVEFLEKIKADREFSILQINRSNLSEIEKMEAIYLEEKRFFGNYDRAFLTLATISSKFTLKKSAISANLSMESLLSPVSYLA